MGRWSKPTKHWCGWLGNWVKIKRQTGQTSYQNWCMLTTPWDWPSLGTTHITDGWVMTTLAHWLLFSHYCGHRKNSVSITTLLTYMSDCAKPSRKCKCSPHLRLKGRGNTMIIRPMPFHWNQVTWSWQKLTPPKGGENWKTSERKNCMKWNAELLKGPLPTSWRTSRPDTHMSSTGIDFFLSTLQWELLYVQVYEMSRPGAPPLSWRNLHGKQVRMRKCHRVQNVCHQPSARQMRLL